MKHSIRLCLLILAAIITPIVLTGCGSNASAAVTKDAVPTVATTTPAASTPATAAATPPTTTATAPATAAPPTASTPPVTADPAPAPTPPQTTPAIIGSLVYLQGTWSTTTGLNTLDAVVGSITIDENGVISSVDKASGCSLNGQITVPDPNLNNYIVTVSYNATWPNCLNGAALTSSYTGTGVAFIQGTLSNPPGFPTSTTPNGLMDWSNAQIIMTWNLVDGDGVFKGIVLQVLTQQSNNYPGFNRAPGG